MALSKNITIETIAKQANVSIATVSRVINKTGKVRPETRSRVLQVMSNLDFIPKQPVQAPSRLGNTILLSFPNQNPFNAEISVGVYSVANQRGYDVFTHQPRRQRDMAGLYESLMHQHQFAGMILAHTIRDRPALEEMCTRYPIVMCSEHYDSDTIPFVAIDDYASAKTAMAYLHSVGRRKTALLNSPLQFNYATQRERAYLDALQAADIPLRSNWVVHLPEINFSLAVSAVTNILRSEPRPDSFFCVSDIFAAAVIKAAGNLGYDVPRDIAVVGFDNIDITNMMVPSITTIAQPTYQIGAQACNLLVDRIQGNRNLSNHIILDTELVVRGST